MEQKLITWEQIKTIAPYASKNADVFVSYLNNTMLKYGINTKLRIAMFVAQLAHESGSFKYTQEIASGRAYEGRKDLGNLHEGDGVRFKGRGLIQITGRSNYRELSCDLGVDFLSNPKLLESPSWAVESAGWFWNKRKLNTLADKGDIKATTRKINGGYNGLEDRKSFYARALEVL